MDNKIPLSVIMENARGKLIQAYNQVLDETKLPAYLMEGMLLELLSETRNRKISSLFPILTLCKIKKMQRRLSYGN